MFCADTRSSSSSPVLVDHEISGLPVLVAGVGDLTRPSMGQGAPPRTVLDGFDQILHGTRRPEHSFVTSWGANSWAVRSMCLSKKLICHHLYRTAHTSACEIWLSWSSKAFFFVTKRPMRPRFEKPAEAFVNKIHSGLGEGKAEGQRGASPHISSWPREKSLLTPQRPLKKRKEKKVRGRHISGH